eukprot:3879488-Amphidinium_carterae.1
MRLQYLALDRPDLQYACKERVRFMKEPTMADMQALKRIGRYLLKRPRMVQVFPRQKEEVELHVVCDTDHAGCLLTRKTSGSFAVFSGRHLLKMSSYTVGDICLSSGESEFYGCVKAAAVGFGAKAMFADFNVEK